MQPFISRSTIAGWRKALFKTTTILGGCSFAFWAYDAKADMQLFHDSNIGKNNGGPVSQKDPITFQADKVSYDDKNSTVIWSGNVQIWQNDHVLRADKVIYDRNTNIASARGNVAIVEPDGEVLFSDYAELTQGMRDAVMSNMYARLADDGKLAATGARRTNGKVSDLSRAVYTACQVCAKDPKKLPFWQLRAYSATHDAEHKRMEFHDSFLDILGVPVGYFPYISMPDPSVKRHSGLLIPSINWSQKFLGPYFTIPYYWVIDNQSDVTFVPLIATKTGPQLSMQYRNRLNFGYISILGGIAADTRKQDGYYNGNNWVKGQSDRGVQGYMFTKGRFAIDENWQAGADINFASSADYMRDYRVTGYGADTLTSSMYLEGFGTGSYAKLDAQAYQSLNRGVINGSELPWVLPHFTYSYFGQPDAWGGRFQLNTTDFYVYRPSGTSDQRGELQMRWDRPFVNQLGQKWLLTLQLDSTLYHSTDLHLQPNFHTGHRGGMSGQVLPTAALQMNWPFLRRFGSSGTQVFEPIVQLIAAPNTGNSGGWDMPNEDSLSYEFTDSTLFSLNRYNGTDRLDGGLRANVGMHGNWTWNGKEIDMLVGESFQQHIQRNRLPNSGLNHHYSDVVGRIRFNPVSWANVTARGRIDPKTGRTNFGDVLFSAGVPAFQVTGGYLWNPETPYYYYSRDYRNRPQDLYYKPISELTAGISTTHKNWHASVFGRRSLSRKQFVALGGSAGYSNDCFGLDVLYIKQYTEIGGERNSSTLMFNVILKTIGAFGING